MLLDPEDSGAEWRELLAAHITQSTHRDQVWGREPQEQTTSRHSVRLSVRNPTRSQRARMPIAEANQATEQDGKGEE